MLAVAALAGLQHLAMATTNCCEEGSTTCCPQPSIYDLSRGMRVVLDTDQCCSGSSDDSWCSPYGVAGCSFCKDECPSDDASCVRCPSAIAEGVQGGDQSGSRGSLPQQDGLGPGDADMWTDEDMGQASGHLNWASNVVTKETVGSYDFSYSFRTDHDCVACSWDRRTDLERRLLDQRSRAMVCDVSCLTGGDGKHGVALCNYFNAGKECRACCQVIPSFAGVCTSFI